MEKVPEAKRGYVSLIDLKNLALTALPSSSTLRHIILSEPDYVPAQDIPVKVDMYSRLLYREMTADSHD